MIRFLSIIILLIGLQYNLKAQNAEQFHAMGKNYLIDGDYSNAESMLFSAYNLDSLNISIIKDLSLCYYFEKEYSKGLQIINSIIDKDSADDQCFQIAGNIYKGLKKYNECEILYQKALTKFPDNGTLNNEMGELLNLQNKKECINYWEKGIEKDPQYPKNYFNAAKFYDTENNNLWSLLYGEIYVNMDPFGVKTAEIKEIILSAYHKIFNSLLSDGNIKDKNKFSQKIFSHLIKQNEIASQGLSVGNLSMIRTRFILDWYFDKADKYPFKLFEFHQYLIREGLFESYNQWLFGSSENLSAFQNWTQLHHQDYAAFTKFLKSNQLVMPHDQYYH
jgi:tetratricopeptide (TPR) repeat protein